MRTLKKLALLLLVGCSVTLMSSTSSNHNAHPNYMEDDGNISAAEFKAQLGLIAWLDDFDFDAKCYISTYTLYYTPRRSDPVTLKAKGGSFNGKINQVIKQAKSGDQYAFVDVKVKCPGDDVSRKANSLYFKIR